MVTIPPWVRTLPTYAKVYWVVVFGAGLYYGVEWLLTPKKIEPIPKQTQLKDLTPMQLAKLKEQRQQQLVKSQESNPQNTEDDD